MNSLMNRPSKTQLRLIQCFAVSNMQCIVDICTLDSQFGVSTTSLQQSGTWQDGWKWEAKLQCCSKRGTSQFHIWQTGLWQHPIKIGFLLLVLFFIAIITFSFSWLFWYLFTIYASFQLFLPTLVSNVTTQNPKY